MTNYIRHDQGAGKVWNVFPVVATSRFDFSEQQKGRRDPQRCPQCFDKARHSEAVHSRNVKRSAK